MLSTVPVLVPLVSPIHLPSEGEHLSQSPVQSESLKQFMPQVPGRFFAVLPHMFVAIPVVPEPESTTNKPIIAIKSTTRNTAA